MDNLFRRTTRTTKWNISGLLFFKESNRLILAYGISEENLPKLRWPITPLMKTIKTYFTERGSKPYKYGLSYVYKTYDLRKELEWTKIEDDLDNLINKYKTILINTNN